MPAPLRPSLLPQCTSCARRFVASGLRPWAPLQQQMRGKKKLSKKPSKPPQTVIVRLLEDVKALGRKGSVVPVPARQMRNKFFPPRIAEYVTDTELKELRRTNASIERDHTFGVEALDIAKPKPEPKPKPKPIEIERISPQRSMELIDIFVPACMDFHEPANDKPQPQPVKEQPRPRGMSAADVFAAASVAPARQEVDDRVGIRGSVSTTDVAAFIKEQLAVNEEGSRVTVSKEDVHFIGGTSADDATRLKFTGEYEVEIKVKGAEEGVRRKLRVIPVWRASA